MFPVLLFGVGCASAGEVAQTSDSGVKVDTPVEGPSEVVDSAEPVSTEPVVVFVNELMPANDGAVEVDGETPDWVELYNPGDEDVSLEGFTITDDLDEPGKALLGVDLVLPAGGFLVLYASGSDAGGAHLPFKLSGDGEAVGLFFPSGEPADRVTFGAVPDNLALARDADGDADWVVTATPTPGAANEVD